MRVNQFQKLDKAIGLGLLYSLCPILQLKTPSEFDQLIKMNTNNLEKIFENLHQGLTNYKSNSDGVVEVNLFYLLQ